MTADIFYWPKQKMDGHVLCVMIQTGVSTFHCSCKSNEIAYDPHVPIYKPQPTKNNIYLYANWSQWIISSSGAPDIAMIYVKKSAKK